MNTKNTQAASAKKHAELAELYHRALEHYQHDRLLEALAIYDEALALAPDQVEIHYSRAIALAGLQRFDEALASLENASARRPAWVEARRYRCVILEHTENYNEALASFDYLLTLTPDDASAHYKRGQVLEKLGRHAEALPNYDRAVALKPDHAIAHCARGNILIRLGRHAEALHSHEKAIAFAPDYADAHRCRGDVLELLGQQEAALASYARAIELRPDYADARHNGIIILLRLGRHEEALALARSAQTIAPNPKFLHLEARCLSSLKQYEKAYAILKRIDATLHDKSFDHHEFMSFICGQTNRHEEGRRHGGIALRLKDASVQDNKYYAIPARPPGASESGRKIISYSLFGAQPRYCEVAIANCDAAAELLPGWSCRFYVDASVPADVLRRLRAKGAEVIMVDDATKAAIHPLMWRFLVADDPEVSRFLLRDADSLIGQREAAAVRAWLKSDRWFHLMRDWPGHCELLLAGMWGGCTGVIPGMRAEIIDFMRQEGGASARPNIDQYFLRQRLWPTVRQSVLAHDSQFDFPGNQAFPPIPATAVKDLTYIGANLSPGTLRMTVDVPDGTLVEWSLLEQDGTVFCRYEALIHGGRHAVNLPYFLQRKMDSGELRSRMTEKYPYQGRSKNQVNEYESN